MQSSVHNYQENTTPLLSNYRRPSTTKLMG